MGKAGEGDKRTRVVHCDLALRSQTVERAEDGHDGSKTEQVLDVSNGYLGRKASRIGPDRPDHSHPSILSPMMHDASGRVVGKQVVGSASAFPSRDGMCCL